MVYVVWIEFVNHERILCHAVPVMIVNDIHTNFLTGSPNNEGKSRATRETDRGHLKRNGNEISTLVVS